MPKRKATPARSEPRREPATESPAAPRGGWWPVRIAGAWIAVGGILKAATGLPSDLPAPILALDLDPLLVLTVAAAVELLVGTLAMAAPRVGWIPASGLLGLFVLILAAHWWQGGGDCGCFGTAMALPPWLMIAIDAGLLVAGVRSGRANRAAAAGTPLGAATRFAAAGGLVLAIGAAAATDRRLSALRPVESVAVVPLPDLAGASEPPKPWSMPAEIPEQVLLRPTQWIGKPLAATEFGRWVDVSGFPARARMIVYYDSCNHCADHLRDLAAAQDAAGDRGETFILAQLPTPKGYTGRLHVDRVPRAAAHVILPDAVKAYVITPPWDVFLEDGRVVRAERVKRSGEKG